jgi:hypothetical protein
MTRALVGTALLVVFATVLPPAAPAGPPGWTGNRLAQGWRDLSPKERGEALRNYERFQKMPPDQRREVERNYDRWQTLPRREKERLRSNYQRYRDLPPEERRRYDRRSYD